MSTKHTETPLKIVEACNAHAELVALAAKLERWERDPDHYTGDLADFGVEARAILAKLNTSTSGGGK